jgi:acylglycerol lipase
MEHTEGKFAARDGLSLYYQAWRPDGNPKAVLLVVHGWAEHSGRYSNLVNYFVPRGYALWALDHRGHGRSGGKRGYVNRFSDYVDDVEPFFDLVRGGHGGIPVFLVGHSLGGTIAVAYALRHQDDLAGLVVSGASLMLGSSLSSALVPFARILSLLVPKLGISSLDASAISQDRAVVDAYVNDPLVFRGKITCRFGAEVLLTQRALSARMPELRLPLLIMHGGADRLSATAGSRMLYEKASSTDKTLKIYDGFHHEIFNEPGRDQVLADMEAWLSARASPRP